MKREYIDWVKTGKKLEGIRKRNETFIKNICYLTKGARGDCDQKCEGCLDMDSYISRAEVASVFYVSENIIQNWESGETPLPVDELLYYSKLSGLDIFDILVFLK